MRLAEQASNAPPPPLPCYVVGNEQPATAQERSDDEQHPVGRHWSCQRPAGGPPRGYPFTRVKRYGQPSHLRERSRCASRRDPISGRRVRYGRELAARPPKLRSNHWQWVKARAQSCSLDGRTGENTLNTSGQAERNQWHALQAAQPTAASFVRGGGGCCRRPDRALALALTNL